MKMREILGVAYWRVDSVLFGPRSHRRINCRFAVHGPRIHNRLTFVQPIVSPIGSLHCSFDLVRQAHFNKVAL